MCLDDRMLSEYIDGELEEPWVSQVKEHLEWCESCKCRYERLGKLKESLSASALNDDSISVSQNRVMRYLNANVLNRPEHRLIHRIKSFFTAKVFMPIIAVTVTFCFCLIIFNPSNRNEEITFQKDSPSLSLDNVIQIRSSDNYTTSQTLNDYSLEEILQYLDDSGYDVTLRNKAVTAVEFPQIEKEFVSKTITPENTGISISSNGFPFTFNSPF